MRKLTSVLTTSALLLLAAACGAQAQTEKKPAASDPQNAQRQTTEKELRSGTRIRGRVITEGGRPVSDASIMVFPANIASNMQGAITSLLRPVTSDADGKFELTSLGPGAYSVSASSPGYVLSDQDSKAFYRPGDTATLTMVKGGVITGKVTNSSGDPVVGALIRAIKVREPNDTPVRARGNIGSQFAESMEMTLGPFKTDDRGIYRIYGLAPGYYQVAAGGRSGQGFSLGGGNAYDGDAPTYYPSSTMETAADVTVLAGEEAANIDIRYRENRGHSIGGTVTVSAGPAPEVTVLLTRADNGVVEATARVMAGRDHFGFDTLLDGEYVVAAMAISENMAMAVGAEGITASASQPRRITVRGADVSGVNLVVEPLASIAGRVVIEPLQDVKQKALCKDVRPVPIEGTVLSARGERKETPVDPISGTLGAFKDTTPNEKGEFIISLLRPGVYRLDVQLPAEHLYVKAITLPQADPKAKPIDGTKSGVKLQSGDKIKGLAVTMSEGAAGLSGKVVIGPKNKLPEAKMRVHLVPAEPEAAEDVLRYFESEVAADGSFALTNLAPGKYWLVGRETSDAEQAEIDHKPLAWDAGTRTALRFEGEAQKTVIELKLCQRLNDFVLSYTPLIKPAKPAHQAPSAVLFRDRARDEWSFRMGIE
jgi:protocatechuate 3,4-dioxygenase beta subunit